MIVSWARGIASVLAAISVAAAGAQTASSENFITIGTGGVTGVYYPAGGAICRLVNKGRKQHGIRCSVESTDGSVFNLNAIAAGELDMAVAQSDWQYHAYNGTSEFRHYGANKGLRAVFSLHAEPFTVVARADSAIASFSDLKGKRVNIGNPGSGQRATMEVVMDALHWQQSDFAAVFELESTDQSAALCDNKLDAIVFTVGHPNASIKEVTTLCEAQIVPTTGPAIDQLVQANHYYRTATIPGGMYRGNPNDVRTFGVGATFVASEHLPADTVYQVVKAVFERFEEFKRLHPALGGLQKKLMTTEGLSIPLHDGAVRYYREAGLM